MNLDISIAIIIATFLGITAWKARFLDAGGIAAAFIVGAAVTFSGGAAWIAPVILFFLLSSILTRAASRKTHSATGLKRDGSRRTAAQVLANGGVPALTSIVFYFNPMPVFYYAFLGSLAAATADTWGTEIGSFSPAEPRLITNFARVPHGRSGAVSAIGTAGVALGALTLSTVGYVSTLLWDAPRFSPFIFLVVAVGGFVGSSVDSLLGATFQARYRCIICGESNEDASHCGSPAVLISGIARINNDMVNLFCSATGAVTVVILFLFL